MPVAKSVIDVILGEAGYQGTDAITYADMMGIASVINNRAIALGVSPEDVIANTREFNAYGKSLPPGVTSYRDMAEEAWGDVQTNGSITSATFYATPKAAKNLPSGLVSVATVPKGHQYFTDPYNRAINTKLGYREPQDITTVNAMVDQRVKTDLQGNIPVPEARPPTMGMPTENPALLSGTPLAEQVDPNFGTGVPMISALTRPVDLAAVQSAQPVAAEQSPALSLDGSNAAAAGLRFDVDPDDSLVGANEQAAAQRMNNPAASALDINKAMEDAIAASVSERMAAAADPKTGRMTGNVQQTADPGRMAESPELSAADRALQEAMKASASSQMMDRFAPHAAPARAFENIATAGIEPGFSETIASTGVPAQSVSTSSITPDSALAQELSQAMDPGRMAPASNVASSNFAEGMQAQRDINEALSAPQSVDVASSRFSTPTTTSRIGTSQTLTDVARMDPLTGVINPATNTQAFTDAPQQPADLGSFPAGYDAQRGPTMGVNSAEMQAMAGSILNQENKDREEAARRQAELAELDAEMQSQRLSQPSIAAESTLAEGINAQRDYVPSTVSDFASEVASQKTDRITPEDAYRMETTTGIAPLVTTTVPELPTIAAPVEDAVPATVSPIADPNAALLPGVTSPDVNPMQSAADRVLKGHSAMDVWSGKATTGTATDGSTVSKLNDGTMGRYVPDYNYTVFSQDQGAHWGTPKPGNLLTQAAVPTTTPTTTTTTTAPRKDPNTALTSPSISAPKTATQKMADSIFSGGTAGALMGTVAGGALLGPIGAVLGGMLGQNLGGKYLGDRVPDQSPFSTLIGLLSGIGSPTGVAPAGMVGGMTVGRDGPAGTPGGWGPGGSVTNTGSSGGYGTTGGVDPAGTY